MTDASANTKKPKHRSPAYPALDLREAIEALKNFHQRESRNAVPARVAIKSCGYSPTGSAGLRCLASLKSYGLLVEEGGGGGGERKVKLSERGRMIVLDHREESPERDKSIRDAALSPPIHQKLWELWRADLPSTATIEHKLTFELGFGTAAAVEVIKEWRATIEFAKLDTSTSSERQGDDLGRGGARQEEAMPVAQVPAITLERASGASVRDLTFPLVGGGMAILRVPLPLTDENFSLITSMLSAMKKALVPAEGKD